MRSCGSPSPVPSGAGLRGVWPEHPVLAVCCRVLFLDGSLAEPTLSARGRPARPPQSALTVPLPPPAGPRFNWRRNSFLSRASQEGIKMKANSFSTLPHNWANVGVVFVFVFVC